MTQRLLATGALLLSLWSCDEPGFEAESLQIPEYALSQEPAATIGGSDQRPEHQLQYADAALRLADGRIVVADMGSSELRLFDAQGEIVRILGRRGEGPGEFQRVRSLMRMPGDSVAVWDATLRRMTLYSPDGVLSSTYTPPALNAVITALQEHAERGVVLSGFVHVLSNDRIMIEPLYEPTSWPSKGVIQDTVRFALLDRTDERWIELGPFPGWERFAHGGTLGPLPFGRNLRFAAGDTLIYIASTYDTAIQILSGRTGEAVGSIALPVRRRAVTPEDIELYRNRRLEGWLGSKEDMVATLDAVPWPNAFPVFSSLRIGDGGLLWVQLFQAPTDSIQEWLVFEESGHPAARVRLDATLQVMDGGEDYLLVRARDGLDVEEIRLYDLVRVP